MTDTSTVLELDPQLGVPFASPAQSAAWEAMQSRSHARKLRTAWSAWREEVHALGVQSGAGKHPTGGHVVRALFGPTPAGNAADGSQSADGDENEDDERVFFSPKTATGLAAFVTARRLRQLNRAFGALWSYTRLHREVWRRGHRAVLAAERKLLLRALDAFWYNVEDGKRVQGAVETMARSSTLRRFFASWRDLTASSTEHRDRAVSILTARRTRAALANSFDEWRSRAVHSHDLAILLEHASGLRLKRTLLRCMAVWAFHAANKQRRKAILADVAPKRQKAQLAACLRAWRAVVDDTKVDMVSVRLAVVRRARHVVTVWRSRCATSRRVAAFTARRSKATLQAAFALWQSSVQLTRARNAAVSALVTYTASRRLAAAFRAWRSVTDVDFMLRASMFAAWRSCTAISRAAEIQHAEALRDAVNATEKSAADAHDLIVNTLTNVAKQQVALQSAAAKAATREAAAKCMSSVRQRAHRRAVFDAWQAECARAERCRVALDTRLAVLRRRALVAAFAEWRHWVAYKKRKRCLAARAQGVAEASQARGLKAIFLAWWRLAHAHQAPRAARAAAAEALAARSRRATLRWALTRWLSGAVEQQREMRKEARAMSHWQTRTLRACIFSWALHVSSQQAVLRRVAAMAARDAIASQRQALRAWKDYVASLKAARAAQQIDMLQAELARLQARYGRLVGAALEDPGAAVLRAAASAPAADMLSYVRTPALSVVHSRVGGVAAVMT